jgi:hypothetical protein
MKPFLPNGGPVSQLWLRLGRAALYRRIAFCPASAGASAPELLDALPITNRRYGRLQICATSFAVCAVHIQHFNSLLACGISLENLIERYVFCASFAHVSLKVMVRLKISLGLGGPSLESESTVK